LGLAWLAVDGLDERVHEGRQIRCRLLGHRGTAILRCAQARSRPEAPRNAAAERSDAALTAPRTAA
jgi:hypothetical protein